GRPCRCGAAPWSWSSAVPQAHGPAPGHAGPDALAAWSGPCARSSAASGGARTTRPGRPGRASVLTVRGATERHGVRGDQLWNPPPLERYPDTYNKKPLCYAGLAAQKNTNTLYLMGAYGDPAQEKRLKEAFRKAGKKMDMGKSCLRFRSEDDLPLDAIGETVASTPPNRLIAMHEAGRRK
ncbi:MAG: DUF1801 domain-containing protein, partial [Gemmatimonadetes bacterium]|nr:DUF1801 domain-containing protein [Gemmatimonadota bacterium]